MTCQQPMAASIFSVNMPARKCADIALAALACIASLFLPCTAHAQDWVARADESVVQVSACPSRSNCDGGTAGTGWLIGQRGYIVTNYHVIDGKTALKIAAKINGKTEVYDVSLAASSPSHDIAILHLNASIGGLAVATKIPTKGEPVTAIGYPGVADQPFALDDDIANMTNSTVTTGIVSRVILNARQNINPTDVGAEQGAWIQHTAAINHGNSGGPLFDQCGRVTGVNTLGADVEINPITNEPYAIAQSMYWSIPVETVIAVAAGANLNLDADVSTAPCTPAKPITKLPQQQNYRLLILAAIGIALLAAITAIIAFVRNPQVKVESYTQFLRRKGGEERFNGTPHRADEVFKLVGQLPQGDYISFLLKDGEGTVGRDQTLCDHVLNEESISRQHLAVRIRNGRVSIRDLGSSNGTFIGNRRIDEDWTLLSEGQEIALGRVRLTLVVKGFAAM